MSTGTQGRTRNEIKANWIKQFAQRSQPFWMGAAALAALVVGLTLIVGGFRKGAHPSTVATSTHAAPEVVTTAGPAVQAVAAVQTQQSAQTTPMLASAAPVSAPTSDTPTSAIVSSTTASSATASPESHPVPETATPGQDAVQTTGPAAPPAKPAADGTQAQAETVARRKRLLEERRQRKAEEASRLAQEAADVRAAQLKEQETRIQAMLVAAKTEYAAGALWQPAGANAADHYRDILKMQPDRAEALAGAQRVANVLAAEAAQTESVGDVYNARLLISQVESLQPDHPKLADLQAKLQQLEGAPTSPDTAVRGRLDRAAKLIARAEEDLGHSPLDYHAVDDATDQYDRAMSVAPMAPGLPSLRERLTGAYVVAAQTQINNRDLKRARKLINTAHKRKWTSDELDQLEASLQAADAPPAATIKEAGASDGSTH